MATNRPLKIAVYSGSIPSTTFIERLIVGLSEMGHEVLLFGGRNGKTLPQYPDNVRTYESQTGWRKALQLAEYSLKLWLSQRAAKARLDRFIRKKSHNRRQFARYASKYYPVLIHRPDIFHLQWAKSLEDWMWVQEFGIKLIVSLRGAHINYSPIADPELAATYRRLFPLVDGFHGVSQAIVDEAAKYGLRKERTAVVYSGLDISLLPFTPAPPPSGGHKLQLLSVGRAHWKKGYAYALRAIKILKEEGIAFTYTIVGGAEDEELRFLRHQLGLTKEVRLLGKVPFAAVQQLIRDSNLLLLPSVEEGIANVVLEAMALGLPVCSTDCGGIREVIAHQKNGWLVPVRQPKNMATAIKEMLALSREDRQRLIEAARQTVERQHNKARMLQDMDELYQRVVTA